MTIDIKTMDAYAASDGVSESINSWTVPLDELWYVAEYTGRVITNATSGGNAGDENSMYLHVNPPTGQRRYSQRLAWDDLYDADATNYRGTAGLYAYPGDVVDLYNQDDANTTSEVEGMVYLRRIL